MIPAHPGCKQKPVRVQPLRVNHTSDHQFPFRLLVTPTSLPLPAKATPVGSPFQVLALTQGVRRVRVSSPRKPLSYHPTGHMITHRDDCLRLHRQHPTAEIWNKGDECKHRSRRFERADAALHWCQIFHFSTDVQTNEIPILSHHCQQVWGFLRTSLGQNSPLARRIAGRTLGHLRDRWQILSWSRICFI